VTKQKGKQKEDEPKVRLRKIWLLGFDEKMRTYVEEVRSRVDDDGVVRDEIRRRDATEEEALKPVHEFDLLSGYLDPCGHRHIEFEPGLSLYYECIRLRDGRVFYTTRERYDWLLFLRARDRDITKRCVWADLSQGEVFRHIIEDLEATLDLRLRTREPPPEYGMSGQGRELHRRAVGGSDRA